MEAKCCASYLQEVSIFFCFTEGKARFTGNVLRIYPKEIHGFLHAFTLSFSAFTFLFLHILKWIMQVLVCCLWMHKKWEKRYFLPFFSEESLLTKKFLLGFACETNHRKEKKHSGWDLGKRYLNGNCANKILLITYIFKHYGKTFLKFINSDKKLLLQLTIPNPISIYAQWVWPQS